MTPYETISLRLRPYVMGIDDHSLFYCSSIGKALEYLYEEVAVDAFPSNQLTPQRRFMLRNLMERMFTGDRHSGRYFILTKTGPYSFERIHPTNRPASAPMTYQVKRRKGETQ